MLRPGWAYQRRDGLISRSMQRSYWQRPGWLTQLARPSAALGMKNPCATIRSGGLIPGMDDAVWMQWTGAISIAGSLRHTYA